jgi:hypothetical protein
MIPFSNTVIRRHLGQIETVFPKPVSMYEPVRHTDFSQTGLAESVPHRPAGLHEPVQETDSESLAPAEVAVFSNAEVSLIRLPETGRADLPAGVQAPPVRDQAILPPERHTTRYSDPPSVDIPSSDSISVFIQTGVENRSMPSDALSAPTIRDRPVSNNANILPEKIKQTVERHMVHTQTERHVESKIYLKNVQNDIHHFVQSVFQPDFSGQQALKPQRATQPGIIATPALPTIKVSIGRIEVKAVVQAPAQTTKSSPQPKPRLSLEDYLKKQDNHAK